MAVEPKKDISPFLAIPDSVEQERPVHPASLPVFDKDTLDLKPQKETACFERFKLKIFHFFRWLLSFICCCAPKSSQSDRSSQPVLGTEESQRQTTEPPSNSDTTKVNPASMGPEVETLSKHEQKNRSIEAGTLIETLEDPVEKTTQKEQILSRIEDEWNDVYTQAITFFLGAKNQACITDEHIEKFRALDESIQFLVVAMQATPEGYEERKILLFYRVLYSTYSCLPHSPDMLSKEVMPQLQNHLLAWVMDCLDPPVSQEAELLENKANTVSTIDEDSDEDSSSLPDIENEGCDSPSDVK